MSDSGDAVRAQDLLERNQDPTEREIRAAIAGNLCRCTGYENIVAAFAPPLAAAPREPLLMVARHLRAR